MRRAAGLLVAALALAAPGARAAEVVSERPDAVSVTIYNARSYRPPGEGDADPTEGLALIAETRTVDVPAGPATIVFRGVAEGIVPQTAAVEGLPGRLLERNQDYDLLSPGALIAKWIGKPVERVTTDPVTGKETRQAAILRSGPAGVVLEIDGRLEPFKCGGPPERLVFAAPSEGLKDKPTLSILSDAPAAGRRTVRLSYLTTGLGWSADYVARIRPDGRTLDLTGWVTLSNESGTTFPDAKTQVLAGRLAIEDDTAPVFFETEGFQARCWPMDTTTKGKPRPRRMTGESYQTVPIAITAYSGDEVEELVVTAQKRTELAELGDYKLYTLPEPTTVAARQTKQVMLLDQAGVRFERLYGFLMNEDDFEQLDDKAAGAPLAPFVFLRLQNETSDGLGKPLPAGKVAVMAADGSGPPVLIGEPRVRDTPVGLPLEIELGSAMDVLVQPRLAEETELTVKGVKKTRREYEVLVANGKDEPITLEYMHPPQEEQVEGGVHFDSRTHPDGSRFGGPLWRFRLKPGERKVLRYSMEWGTGEATP